MKVSKELRFEAGHRLINGYPGNCRNLHGHSYVVTIEMTSQKRLLNDYDFVKDFGEFKPLKQWIDDNWDHSLIIASKDSSLIEFVEKENQRHYIINGNPTAENMCIDLFKVAGLLLNDDWAVVTAVKVYETTTSEAVYSPPVTLRE